MRGVSRQLLDAVLDVLHESNNSLESVELSFHLYDHSFIGVATDVEIVDLLHSIRRINRKYPVTSLEIGGNRSPRKFQYLLPFRQLRNLRLSGDYAIRFDCPADLQGIFNGVPLESLSLECPDIIASLPPTLRSLYLHDNYSIQRPLSTITWAAICALPRLIELHLDYDNVNPLQENMCIFKSSNMRTFQGIVIDRDTNFSRQILQPIMMTCRLASAHLILYNGPVSPETIKSIFTTNVTLSRLEIESYEAISYTFRDLADHAKNLPNLKDLILPWPASYLGKWNGWDKRNHNKRSRDKRNRDGDIPERLSFQECAQLAAACPMLDQVILTLDSERSATQYQYTSWNPDSVSTKHMPLDSNKLGDAMVAHHTLVQSFKMARFIDESSPCLNVCTVLFPFGDGTYMKERGYKYNILNVIFLSLKQVRKYANHL